MLGVSAYGASGALARPGPDVTNTAIALGAAPGPGSGVEPDLHRDADRDEHGEFVESAPRSHRSHSHLRCLQRDQAPLHADLRPERRRQRREPRSSRSVAPSSSRCCRVHGARGPVSRLGRHSWVTVTRLRSRRSATMAETADNHGSAASRGARTSRRPSSPGARQMASARATRRSPEEQRSASGARSRPRRR